MEEQIVIMKGRQSKAFPELIKKVMELAVEGWVPKDNFELVNSCRMYSQNWFTVTLVKGVEEKSVEIPTELPEEKTEEISSTTEGEEASELAEEVMKDRRDIMLERIHDEKSKKGLLLLATTFEIDVPEDKQKNAAQIRKFLKDTINKSN